MMRIVYLLSDFGTVDTYAAQMKAVIAGSVPPDTVMIDLTHQVRPGSIIDGAFHLYSACPYIQPGSVVIAVVDPGVGTDRGGVVCESGGFFLVGPDNGLFGLLHLQRAWILPEAFDGTSSTFHGRDIFAPAGARLIDNPHWVQDLEEIPCASMVPCGIVPAAVHPRKLYATVVHVDSFGNVILWLSPRECMDLRPKSVVLPDGSSIPVTRVDTYSGNRGLLLLEGSQGLMELALSGGSASEEYELAQGDRLLLETATG